MSNFYDMCLIGLGPAGIGFLSSLDSNILGNSICFEKGTTDSFCNCQIDSQSRCAHCNHCRIVSGLGGASRFSCGKISNFPAGSGLEFFFESREALVSSMNSEIQKLKSELNMNEFIVSNTMKETAELYFKNKNISFKYYDVYEFNKEIYTQYLTKKIEEANNSGLKVCYDTEVINIEKTLHEDKSAYIITVKNNNLIKKYKAKTVVIATGNIINNTAITKKLTNIINSTYEIGIRITVPTEKISDFLSYHGDLKLKYKNGRTYCVSKNGFVIAYSVDDLLLLEGFVDDKYPTDTTNFAIIFKVDQSKEIDLFKNKYKNYFRGIPVKQKYIDYLNNVESNISFKEKYIPVQKGNIRNLFNKETNFSIIEFIDSVLIKALNLKPEDMTLYAPELKTTTCINLDKDFKNPHGVYIIGAATGKFRGILQSFCSGIRCGKIVRG